MCHELAYFVEINEKFDIVSDLVCRQLLILWSADKTKSMIVHVKTQNGGHAVKISVASGSNRGLSTWTCRVFKQPAAVTWLAAFLRVTGRAYNMVKNYFSTHSNMQAASSDTCALYRIQIRFPLTYHLLLFPGIHLLVTVLWSCAGFENHWSAGCINEPLQGLVFHWYVIRLLRNLRQPAQHYWCACHLWASQRHLISFSLSLSRCPERRTWPLTPVPG